MYYVMYVGAGRENQVETLIQSLMDENLYEKCYHPVRHMKKKIRGKWMDVYERLIPGYIFVMSDNIVPFYLELKNIPRFHKLLGSLENGEITDFYPLTEKEEKWLRKLSGNMQDQGSLVAEVSQVSFDEQDQVVILSGPLKGMEGQVRKINLHKRIAEVEVEFMNRTTILHLGIEIVEKKCD